MELESFSQRLLNPFRGVQRVLRYGPAEAVTTDGVHWDLYVSNDELLEGLDRSHPVLVSDIRFGRWSADKGLKRGPLYPSEDFRRMERVGTVLYEALTQLHDQPVFPFKDCYELWLLDAVGAPLALLSSVVSADEMDLDLPLVWRPGQVSEPFFRSSLCDKPGEYLSRYINGRAGRKPAAVWLLRAPDGSGQAVAGINLPGPWAERTWSATEFPAFYLGEVGHDAAHRQLIADFHAWQAPCLLLLPGWLAEVRRQLEAQARRQAETVGQLFRLYPDAVDERFIQAARVEVLLKRSQALRPAQEEVLSTFYIELNPGEADVV